MLKKFTPLTLLFLLVFSIGISFAGCAKSQNRKIALNPFAVKPPDPNTVMVAVLPIQNATFHPIRITGKQGAIGQFLEGFMEKRLRFKYTEDDVAYVQKTLQLILTQRLYNSGYQALSPDDIYSAFAKLGLEYSDKDLDVAAITPSIPADWLYLVTLTDWEGEKFSKLGTGKFSYQAVIVDTRLKQAIWQKSRDNIRFQAPSRSLPYNRQGGQMLNEIAKIIMKDIPEPEKITDYKNKQLVTSS